MDLLYYIYSLKCTFIIHVFTSYIFANPVKSEAVVITQDNIDTIIASNDLVFINFYADWCRFSQLLAPIFDRAADMINVEFPDVGRVVMGKVNCMVEISIAMRFLITKYPTLKLIRNGQLLKSEYRGQRISEALVEFIKKQLKDPIKEFQQLDDLRKLDSKRRNLIGFFDHKDVLEYDIFKRVSANMRDDCELHVGFGLLNYDNLPESAKFKSMDYRHPNFLETVLLPLPGKHTISEMKPPGQPIVIFRPDVALSNEGDEVYKGSLLNYDEVHKWMSRKCLPLVREITFENAEDLTEEGLPFLILFHKPDDFDVVKRFKDVCKTLMHQRQNIVFLTADGEKFAHPLQHLGRSQSDLPLITIDSFRHMHLFSDISDMEVPGKLEQFIKDLHSGKLHRDLHNISDDVEESQDKPTLEETQLPESAFKSLTPSNKRYTLLRDEL